MVIFTAGRSRRKQVHLYRDSSFGVLDLHGLKELDLMDLVLSYMLSFS